MFRWTLGLVAALVVVGGATAGPPATDAPQLFVGKIKPITASSTAAKSAVALHADDGKVYPLVEDDVSRLLFLDSRLQDRPIRLTAKLVPGTDSLKISLVRTLKDGKPHEVYYWCEPCKLAATEPGPCKCCGGPTELVEVPAK